MNKNYIIKDWFKDEPSILIFNILGKLRVFNIKIPKLAVTILLQCKLFRFKITINSDLACIAANAARSIAGYAVTLKVLYYQRVITNFTVNFI